MDTAPRSLDEVRALLMRDDGWLASLRSYLPHRVLDDLLQRSEGARPTFPESHLPMAALAAVHVFLTNTNQLPPPGIQRLISEIGPQHRQQPKNAGPLNAVEEAALSRQISRDQLAASRIAARIHSVITTTLGPVENWGKQQQAVHPGDPPRTPTRAARLAALEGAITAAKVQLSLDNFADYATLADQVGRNTAMAKDAPWRPSVPIKGFIRAALQQYYTQGVTAIAYQDLSERYRIDAIAQRPVGDAEATRIGQMLVDLARELRAVRPLRTEKRSASGDATRVALETALESIAARDGVPIPPRRTLIDRMLQGWELVGNYVRQIATRSGNATAAAAVEASGTVTGALRQGLEAIEEKALFNAVVAARVLSDVYREARERRPFIAQHAQEALPEQRYREFLSLLRNQELLTNRDRATLLRDPAIATKPMSLLTEALRQGYAHRAVWQYLHLCTQRSPHAPIAEGLPSPTSFFANLATEHRGDPAAALPRGVTDQGVLVAAIAALQHQRGVPIAQLWDDLEKNRLPGVRGTCEGNQLLERAATREWDLICKLGDPDRRFVDRVLQAAEGLRAGHQNLATHGGYYGTPPSKLAAPVLLPIPPLRDDAHLREPKPMPPSLDKAVTFHRGPFVDGLAGFLITEYAHLYAGGRVRVRSDEPQVGVDFVRIAVLEAHQTAKALLPPGLPYEPNDPIAVHWVSRIPPQQQMLETAGAVPSSRTHEARATAAERERDTIVRYHVKREPAEDGQIVRMVGIASTNPETHRHNVTLFIEGTLPPSAQDALGAVGVHPPAEYPAHRQRAPRPKESGDAAVVEGTQAHRHLLALATLELYGEPRPTRGLASRVQAQDAAVVPPEEHADTGAMGW
ncbi:MAG: hypothetical protein H3C62_01005 [Gemmatimonadaceae bacterium]|nr:hypothetical protein [Gemmatimonadaceae bacterium]